MNGLALLPGLGVSSLLAWHPFLQPAPGVQRWWWILVLPMAVGVSLAYKSTRTVDLERLPREALRMSVQVVAALVGIALFLYLLVIVVLPHLPVE